MEKKGKLMTHAKDSSSEKETQEGTSAMEVLRVLMRWNWLLIAKRVVVGLCKGLLFLFLGLFAIALLGNALSRVLGITPLPPADESFKMLGSNLTNPRDVVNQPMCFLGAVIFDCNGFVIALFDVFNAPLTIRQGWYNYVELVVWGTVSIDFAQGESVPFCDYFPICGHPDGFTYQNFPALYPKLFCPACGATPNDRVTFFTWLSGYGQYTC